MTLELKLIFASFDIIGLLKSWDQIGHRLNK